eukprot:954393-Rhodomonas_salina.1
MNDDDGWGQVENTKSERKVIEPVDQTSASDCYSAAHAPMHAPAPMLRVFATDGCIFGSAPRKVRTDLQCGGIDLGRLVAAMLAGRSSRS